MVDFSNTHVNWDIFRLLILNSSTARLLPVMNANSEVHIMDAYDGEGLPVIANIIESRQELFFDKLEGCHLFQRRLYQFSINTWQSRSLSIYHVLDKSQYPTALLDSVPANSTVDTLVLSSCLAVIYDEKTAETIPSWCRRLVLTSKHFCVSSLHGTGKSTPYVSAISFGAITDLTSSPATVEEIYLEVSLHYEQWLLLLENLKEYCVDVWERLLTTRVYVCGCMPNVSEIGPEIKSELEGLATQAGMYLLHVHAGEGWRLLGWER